MSETDSSPSGQEWEVHVMGPDDLRAGGPWTASKQPPKAGSMSNTEFGRLSLDDPRHGTKNGYMNFGCRCFACKAAYAEYSRTRYAARAKTPPPVVSLPGETWRSVPDFEGYYEVSDHGRVRSLDRRGVASTRPGVPHFAGQLLKYSVGRRGRRQVLLKKSGKTKTWPVHRLVATVFIGPNPPGLECCHNDGNHLNNHVSNLRWDTRSANQRDRIRHEPNHVANRTECSKGHDYTDENTYVDKNGWRHCKTCARVNEAARTAARRANEKKAA